MSEEFPILKKLLKSVVPEGLTVEFVGSGVCLDKLDDDQMRGMVETTFDQEWAKTLTRENLQSPGSAPVIQKGEDHGST